MSEIMNFEEMKHHYAGEWLLIAYTEIDDNLQVKKGEVLAHSPQQKDIYQALNLVKDIPVAIEYVGEVPEDLAFVL
jgi:hypothetical protein